MARKIFEVNHFSASELAQIEGLLQQLLSIVANRTEAMTPDDRRRYGSINEQNKLFVDKVMAYKTSHPALLTPGLDWAKFEAEHEQRKFIGEVLAVIATVIYELQSTKIALDNNNYGLALIDYAFTDVLNLQGAVGITQKIADLAQFFPRSKAEDKTEDKDDTKGEDKDAKDSESTTEEEK